MALRIFRQLLDKTLTHQRNAPTADPNGGEIPGFATVTSNVRCAVWPIESNKAEDYARRDILVTHAVCADVDLGAKAEDIMLIGGDTYIVQGLEPYSNTGILSRPLYVMHCELRTK